MVTWFEQKWHFIDEIHCVVNTMNEKFYSLLVTILKSLKNKWIFLIWLFWFVKSELRKCSNTQRCMCGNDNNWLGTCMWVQWWCLGCHEYCNDIVDIMYPYWIVNSIQCEFKNFHFGNIIHVLHELIMYLNEFTWWVNYIAWNIL
jgi:hypothetical protein